MHFVIVLGCKRGMKNKNKNIINQESHIYTRLEKAITVYQQIDSDEKMIVCTGGNNEAILMKKYLINRGLQASRIYTEIKSKSTIENCIFTYDHISYWLASEPTIQELDGINILNLHKNPYYPTVERLDYIDCSHITIHLITSDYHMKRSKMIFDRYMYIIKRRNPNVVCKFKYHPSATNDGNMKKWIKIEENIMKNLNLKS